MTAINSWRQKYKKTGEIKNKPLCRTPRKLDNDKLISYVKEHPDAYLKEIAEAFGCSVTAVAKALKRLGITRKKRQRDTGNRMQSK